METVHFLVTGVGIKGDMYTPVVNLLQGANTSTRC